MQHCAWKLFPKVFHIYKIINIIISRLSSKALPIIYHKQHKLIAVKLLNWRATLLIITCNDCCGHCDQGKSMKEIFFFPPLTNISVLLRKVMFKTHLKIRGLPQLDISVGYKVVLCLMLPPKSGTYEPFLTVAFCARGVNPQQMSTQTRRRLASCYRHFIMFWG